MLKVLIKKELGRFTASLSTSGSKSKKKKKVSSKGSKIAMIILWIFVFFSLAMAFAGMGALLAGDLVMMKLDWLYYALIGIVGLVLSILGNSFTSMSSIYKAKDNDLLLSMPIPPKYILISRLSLSFVLSVLYTAVYMVPAVCVHAGVAGGISVSEIICAILMIIIMALVVTALSAGLGWVLALISRHIRNKAAATTVFTLVFLCGYYYFYFNINKYLTKLAEAAVGIGEAVEASAFGVPIMHFGQALCGNFSSVLFWLVIAAVLTVIVFRILDRSFIKITTATEKTVNVRYDEEKQEQVKLESPKKALLKKELARFTSSPTYMINCGLGILVIIAAAVMMFVKKDVLMEVIDAYGKVVPNLKGMMVLIMSGIACLMLSMIDIAAPSISLEGKNLWILKSSPISTSDIFYAKTNLQLLFSVPPLVIFLISYAIVFKADISDVVFIALLAVLFVRLHSQLGVYLGLMFPKLDWTNEAVPVKQSLAVLLSMMSGIVFVGIVGVLYWFVLKKFCDPSDMFIGLVFVLAIGSKLFDKWFAVKGAKRFAEL